jgi:hypothetical protein
MIYARAWSDWLDKLSLLAFKLCVPTDAGFVVSHFFETDEPIPVLRSAADGQGRALVTKAASVM